MQRDGALSARSTGQVHTANHPDDLKYSFVFRKIDSSIFQPKQIIQKCMQCTAKSNPNYGTFLQYYHVLLKYWNFKNCRSNNTENRVQLDTGISLEEDQALLWILGDNCIFSHTLLCFLVTFEHVAFAVALAGMNKTLPGNTLHLFVSLSWSRDFSKYLC